MLRLCIVSFVAALAASTSLHAAPAQRIVSLAPNLTELVFNAGAGDRIVATVEFSDLPEAARRIPRIGDAFRVDLERLLQLKPDVVLVWESGTPKQTVDRIRALNLRVVSFETLSLEQVADVVRSLGELAGTESIADEVAAKFDRDVRELREEFRGRSAVSVFLQVNDRPLYTVNGKHIMSEILGLCGGRNVFAGLTELAPAIGIESVIAANPQVIISTDDTVPDAATSWRQWRHVDAVKNGNVFTLRSDDIARATLRLTDGARDLCRTLDTARQRIRESASR